jgi:AmiR/NasT family two-component response regulator
MTMRIPNFRGQRALLLHHRDHNLDMLTEQLEKLGIYVSIRWPAEAVSASEVDLVFFDSDLGFNGLFAWAPGAAPVPLIAMIGSEAALSAFEPAREQHSRAAEPPVQAACRIPSAMAVRRM